MKQSAWDYSRSLSIKIQSGIPFDFLPFQRTPKTYFYCPVSKPHPVVVFLKFIQTMKKNRYFHLQNKIFPSQLLSMFFQMRPSAYEWGFPSMEFPSILYLRSNRLIGTQIYFLWMTLQFLPWEPGCLSPHLSCWWHSESACGTAMPRKQNKVAEECFLPVPTTCIRNNRNPYNSLWSGFGQKQKYVGCTGSSYCIKV